MYRCSVLVALVVAAALGHQTDAGGNQGSSQQLSEMCLFDQYPSASCKLKCEGRNLEPYCEKNTQKCLCKRSKIKLSDDDLFNDLLSADINNPPKVPETTKKVTKVAPKKQSVTPDDDDDFWDDFSSDEDDQLPKKKVVKKTTNNNYKSKTHKPIRTANKKKDDVDDDDDNDDNDDDDFFDFTTDDQPAPKDKHVNNNKIKQNHKSNAHASTNKPKPKSNQKKDDGDDDGTFDFSFDDDDSSEAQTTKISNSEHASMQKPTKKKNNEDSITDNDGFDFSFSNDDDQKPPLVPSPATKKHLTALSVDHSELKSLNNICLMDKYPSASCTMKCQSKNMQPYCDRAQKKCLCRHSSKAINSDDLIDDLASDDDDLSPPTTPSLPKKPDDMPTSITLLSGPSKVLGELCFLGTVPSATCRYKCHSQNMESYCDKEQKKCHCKNKSKDSPLSYSPADDMTTLLNLVDDHEYVKPTRKPTDLSKPLSAMCFEDQYPSATCAFKCELKNLKPYCDQDAHECRCKPSTESGVNNNMHSFADSGDNALQQMMDDATPTVVPADTPTVPEPGQGMFDLVSHIRPLFHIFNNVQDVFSPFSSGTVQPVEIPATPTAADICNICDTGDEPINITPETNNKPLPPVMVVHVSNQPIISDELPELLKPEDIPSFDEEDIPGVKDIPEEEVVHHSTHWSFQHYISIVIIFLLIALIALELFACYRRRLDKRNVETVFKTVPGTKA